MKSPGSEWAARVRWQCRAVADKADHLDILALTLIAVIIGLALTVLAPLTAMGNRLDADISVLSRQATMPPPPVGSPASRSPNTHDALHEFLMFLPESSQRPHLLRQLHDLGTSQGLKTGKVEYRPIAMTHLPVDGLWIRLEWQGDDTALRAALHRLLHDFPSLAIRALTQGRNPDNGLSSLSLEFVLYYRREGSHAP